MNYIIYIIVPVIIVLVSIKFFSKAAGTVSLTSLNTISYLLYSQLLPVAAIGSILVANNLVDNHYVIARISDVTKLKGLYWVLYSLIMMPISMMLLNKIFRVNIKKRYADYLSEKVILQKKGNKSLVMWIFSSLSLFTFLYIIIYSPSYPFLTAILDGNLLSASVGRIDVRYNFKGIVQIKNLFGFYLVPIFSYFTYCYYHIDKTKTSKFHFVFNFLIAVLILTFDTQKAPVAIFLVGFLIVRSLLGEKLKLRSLFAWGIGLLIIIFAAYIFISGHKLEHLLRFDSVIMYRLFVGQIGGYFLSLEWFPDIITESTLFVGLPSIFQDALNLEIKESARLLMEYFNPTGVQSGIAGLMNSYFLGEAWANYSYLGLLVSPIIVGFTIQGVHLWLLKSKKTPLNIAFYTGITIRWMITGGFVNFLYMKQILYPIALYIFVKYLIEFFYTVASNGRVRKVSI